MAVLIDNFISATAEMDQVRVWSAKTMNRTCLLRKGVGRGQGSRAKDSERRASEQARAMYVWYIK